MSVQEQIGLGSRQQLRMIESVAVLPESVTASLLGNQSAQTPSSGKLFENLVSILAGLFIGSQPNAKLTLVKQRKFTPDGKQLRVAASLAALYAAQPTELSLSEWKEIVEEIEDDED